MGEGHERWEEMHAGGEAGPEPDPGASQATYRCGALSSALLNFTAFILIVHLSIIIH